MKAAGLISTGVLILLLGSVAPTYAQEPHEQDSKPPKQEQQAKPEKQQAKPEKQQESKPEKQPAKPEQRQQAKGQQEHPQQQQAKPAKQEEQQRQAKGQQQGQEKQQQQQAKQEQQQTKGHQEQQQKQEQARGGQQGQPHQQHAQRTPDEDRRQRAEPALRLSVRGQGRIPDDRFRSNFGREHIFRISSPRIVDGYSRFEYGGYWFGFVQPWPDGWYYTDDVYVDFADGEYFLFNPNYPDVRVSLSVVI
jgi:hypothetical protein